MRTGAQTEGADTKMRFLVAGTYDSAGAGSAFNFVETTDRAGRAAQLSVQSARFATLTLIGSAGMSRIWHEYARPTDTCGVVIDPSARLIWPTVGAGCSARRLQFASQPAPCV